MLGNFKILSGKSQEFQLLISVETLESVSPADSTSDSLEYNMRRLEYSMRRLGVQYEKIRVRTVCASSSVESCCGRTQCRC